MFPSLPLSSFALALIACALLATPGAARADAAAKPGPDTARIHYHRARGDYDGWGTHQWDGARTETAWSSPAPPTGRDDFGPYWDVALKPGATRLGIIVHKGDQKDPGPDMFLDLSKQKEAWIVSGRNELNASPPDVSGMAFGDLSRARAHWVDRHHAAVAGRTGERLHVRAARFARRRAARHAGGRHRRHLGAAARGCRRDERRAPRALPLPRGRHRAQAGRGLRRARARVAARPGGGLLARRRRHRRRHRACSCPACSTTLFAWDGPLGITWRDGAPSLRLWAPTARKVRCCSTTRRARPRRSRPWT